VENLRYAAGFLERHGIAVVIEPINKKMGLIKNGPSYTRKACTATFSTTPNTRGDLEQVGSRNLYLHLDVYHMQVLEGHLAETIERTSVSRAISDRRGARPPRTAVGEINYPYLFRPADSLGYQRWIGCEYRPRGNTWKGWPGRRGTGFAPRGSCRQSNSAIPAGKKKRGAWCPLKPRSSRRRRELRGEEIVSPSTLSGLSQARPSRPIR